uniref:uncharacterized protein LOC122611340 n=1 Tax=Erigeron canadensis TaxID=72917 RepID=UPI001CB89A3B|nr:uncharacterized protein LOC122611340 [Erigeron canadensis]
MAATTLFSSPISHHNQYPISIQQFSSFGSNNNNKLLLLQPVTARSSLILIRASSSSPSTVDKQEKDDDDEQQESSSSDTFTQPINSIPLGGCKSCGKAEIERGCNGEGRIQGGIATVPGFGWWPIKAYRPCPGFIATGGRYRRQGQSMDEVAGFGTVPRTSPTTTTSVSATATGETESSEKKQGPRKFKR